MRGPDGVWRGPGPGPGSVPGTSWTPNGLPTGGVLVGNTGYGGNLTSVALVDADLGVTSGIHRMYATTATSGVAAAIAADHAHGSIPWISFKLPNSGTGGNWAAAAAGTYDTQVQTVASVINGITTGPVWVAIHHEPDGDPDGTYADFRAMQRRLLPMFTGAHVCKTVILGGYGATHYGVPTWDDAYPGPGYIDVMGFDPYNLYSSDLGSQWTEFGDTHPTYFPALSAWAAGKGIRWAVGETGWTDGAFAAGTVTGFGDAALWYQRQIEWAAAYGAAAVAYFSVYYAPPTNSWNFMEKPEKIAAVAAAQQLGVLFPFQ